MTARRWPILSSRGGNLISSFKYFTFCDYFFQHVLFHPFPTFSFSALPFLLPSHSRSTLTLPFPKEVMLWFLCKIGHLTVCIFMENFNELKLFLWILLVFFNPQMPQITPKRLRGIQLPFGPEVCFFFCSELCISTINFSITCLKVLSISRSCAI